MASFISSQGKHYCVFCIKIAIGSASSARVVFQVGFQANILTIIVQLGHPQLFYPSHATWRGWSWYIKVDKNASANNLI